ncbi:hypothetical protein DRW41_08760 [Neobacillus piezotolerans]|uniref:Uncharacterized protein n=1 Tax=Neobacillus piezotolerans TaxID=2259171 RepID=A0A3D8GTX6_9BACI|nr:hypothetical protein [Neobacillus piezotolerans]RDU37895.1 hypothetical protein DRW41_08760 [Neobacillus piezotolerans]
MGEVWYPSMGPRYSEKGGLSMEGWFPGLDRRSRGRSSRVEESSSFRNIRDEFESQSFNFERRNVNNNVRERVDVEVDVENEFVNEIDVENENDVTNFDRNKNIARIRRSGNAKICLDINVDADSAARVRSSALSEQDQEQEQNQRESFDF